LITVKTEGADVKVLLIDDEAALKDSVVRTLTDLGADVTAVPCCIEANKRLLETDFEVAVLDCGIVERTGIDCLSNLRGQHMDLPIVVLTEHCNEDLARCLYTAGADDYVPKPELDVLLEHVVWSAIERRKAKRMIETDTQLRRGFIESIRRPFRVGRR
jgi:DNA-binding response OmpR family regulator